MKVSDYVAECLVKHGIKTVFGVVGGGAMHLDDSFAHCNGLSFYYNHHEQASAMAAESYARVNNEMAAVSVTTGPGGTNAITGVLCAWQDSIPMLVVSGQVRSQTTVESSGLELRQFGEQEHYIVKTVKDITKYAVTVYNKKTIRYHLEKAIYEATHGRRGPCWVDIPLDIQGDQINPDDLEGYIPEEKDTKQIEKTFKELLCVISKAKRPLVIAGSAIRTANVYREFRYFIEKYKIPTVVGTAIADLFPVDYEHYYGNFGIIGGRCGNFIVQNADCIIVLGCRMAFKHIGFNYEQFSPNSIKIVIDVDENELKKKTLRIDYPVCADLKEFFDFYNNLDDTSFNLCPDEYWKLYCDELKTKFPIYKAVYEKSKSVNPYHFAEIIKKYSDENMLTVVGNSCACDCVRQCGISKEGQRLWGNTDCGTMGYDLPAAIGAAVACGHSVNCVTGDGSIQMNIQELLTIVHNKLPIKIFIHSNGGYFAIVQTHTNFFGRLSGCTSETGISMPDFEKIAWAYGIPYYRCRNHMELEEIMPKIMSEPAYCICEVESDTDQPIEPKSKSKILENGDMISPPIDDLYPFLEKEIYQKYSDFSAYKGRK